MRVRSGQKAAVDVGEVLATYAPTTHSWSRRLVLDEPLRRELQEMLDAVVLPEEPNWPPAARGDASSAINLAIRAAFVGEHHLTPFRSVIMVALWRCAAEGDVTASLVLRWLEGATAAETCMESGDHSCADGRAVSGRSPRASRNGEETGS